MKIEEEEKHKKAFTSDMLRIARGAASVSLTEYMRADDVGDSTGCN